MPARVQIYRSGSGPACPQQLDDILCKGQRGLANVAAHAHAEIRSAVQFQGCRQTTALMQACVLHLARPFYVITHMPGRQMPSPSATTTDRQKWETWYSGKTNGSCVSSACT